MQGHQVNSVCDLGTELGLISIEWEGKALPTEVLCCAFLPCSPGDVPFCFGDPGGVSSPAEEELRGGGW